VGARLRRRPTRRAARALTLDPLASPTPPRQSSSDTVTPGMLAVPEPAALLEAHAIVAPPPRWVAPVFLVLGVGLIPWTVVLAITLPSEHGTHHNALAWAGFDAALAGLLIATAVGTARRAIWLQGGSGSNGRAPRVRRLVRRPLVHDEARARCLTRPGSVRRDPRRGSLHPRIPPRRGGCRSDPTVRGIRPSQT